MATELCAGQTYIALYISPQTVSEQKSMISEGPGKGYDHTMF